MARESGSALVTAGAGAMCGVWIAQLRRQERCRFHRLRACELAIRQPSPFDAVPMRRVLGVSIARECSAFDTQYMIANMGYGDQRSQTQIFLVRLLF